jgi:glycosyltransferase involved in cell wall biosynthesis
MKTATYGDFTDVKVVIALPNLAPGGAQTQGLILARELIQLGIPTGVFLTHSAEATASNQELSHGVPVLFSQDIPVRKPLVEIIERGFLTIIMKVGFHRLSPLLKGRICRRILRKFDLPTTVQNSLKTNLKIALAARSFRIFLEDNEKVIVISFLPQTNIASIIAAVPLTFTAVIERNDFDHQQVGEGIRHAQMLLYPRANLIGSNSRNATMQMSAHFLNRDIHFIPNAYRATRRSWQDSRTEKLILVVGRLEKQKRPLEVLKACIDSQVLAQGWKIAFAGSGSLENELRELQKTVPNYQDSVLILGHLQGSELPYSAATISILNSDYEGSPNVLAESISSGAIPLVRASIAEFSEFIPPEFQHSLVFKDVDSLTKILRDIAGLIDKQAEIRERLTHHFNLRLKEYSIKRDKFMQLIEIESSSRN